MSCLPLSGKNCRSDLGIFAAALERHLLRELEFSLPALVSRGNALNFRAVKCKCWMSLSWELKRGKKEDRGQDYSWTDGGNGSR